MVFRFGILTFRYYGMAELVLGPYRNEGFDVAFVTVYHIRDALEAIHIVGYTRHGPFIFIYRLHKGY